MAVMPGPTREGDLKELIRTDYKNLENPAWWKSQKLDGVVLYDWALPKYTPLIKAIKKSGAWVFINMDNNGIISPIPHALDFYVETMQAGIRVHGAILGFCIGIFRSLKASIPWTMDIPRLHHMGCADKIGAVSPIALTRIKRHCLSYGYGKISNNIFLVPHPVSSIYQYDGSAKKDLVVAVGRWTKADSWQKNPKLLVGSLAKFLANHPSYNANIIGHYDEIIKDEILQLQANIRKRIELTGRLDPERIAAILNTAKISLCTSLTESFHIASGEALCCGASIVSYKSPFLSSFPFLTSHDSGTLAPDNSSVSIADALANEAMQWKSKKRSPIVISEYWNPLLHEINVAQKIINLFDYSAESI